MKIHFLKYLSLVLCITLFSACDNREKASDTAGDEVQATTLEASLKDKNDEVPVAKKIESAVTDLKTKLPEETKANIYNPTEVDRPPLFTKACLNHKGPKKCSEEESLAFIKENIEVPKGAKESLEQVIFIVQKDGSIQNVKYAVSGNDKCKGCQQAAVDVIAKMDEWQPAMLDGKPVAVQMTLPVRFKR